MSITCTLQPEDELVCETLADGSPIPPLNGDGADPTFPILKGRTNRWSLEEPELLMSMITLNSAVTAAFDKEIASSGLVLEFRSYQAVNQSILHASTDLAFHISKSNITDVFFAMEHEWTALSHDRGLALPWYKGLQSGTTNDAVVANRGDVNNDLAAAAAHRLQSDATAVGRQRFKAVNFYPWSEYMTSAGLGSAAMKAQRERNKPSWRLMLGSKPIPENFCNCLLYTSPSPRDRG